MLDKGNEDPYVCASNLLKMSQYELHLLCDMGLNPDLFDNHSEIGEIRWDAARVINTFERRVNIHSVQVERTENGGYSFWFGMGDQP